MSKVTTFSDLIAIVPRIALLGRRRPEGDRDVDRACWEEPT
jgi:hypothetical protein